jgi:HEAT repeat protein
VAQAKQMLRSEDPRTRFRAAEAAERFADELTPELVAALGDPVLNVRYKAANALGASRLDAARKGLLSVVQGPELWYVKEYAYNALWRQGWRPKPQ